MHAQCACTGLELKWQAKCNWKHMPWSFINMKRNGSDSGEKDL